MEIKFRTVTCGLVIIQWFGIACLSNAGTDDMDTCVPVTLEMCASLLFNSTRFPNVIGHTEIGEAVEEIKTFQPFLERRCSYDLELLICSVLFPICFEGSLDTLGACRDVCEKVQWECGSEIRTRQLEWPKILNCSLLPDAGENHTTCISIRDLSVNEEGDTQDSVAVSIATNGPIYLHIVVLYFLLSMVCRH